MIGLVDILRLARARIARGEGVWLALNAEASGLELQTTIDLLTQIFLPTAHAFEEAVRRFASTGDEAEGKRALWLSRMPGAHLQLWSWLEASDRQPWDVLAGIDKAILRARQ